MSQLWRCLIVPGNLLFTLAGCIYTFAISSVSISALSICLAESDNMSFPGRIMKSV